MIKNMVTASSYGKMDENTRDSGTMVNSMDLVPSPYLEVNAVKAYGNMEKESNGLTRKLLKSSNELSYLKYNYIIYLYYIFEAICCDNLYGNRLCLTNIRLIYLL